MYSLPMLSNNFLTKLFHPAIRVTIKAHNCIPLLVASTVGKGDKVSKNKKPVWGSLFQYSELIGINGAKAFLSQRVKFV